MRALTCHDVKRDMAAPPSCPGTGRPASRDAWRTTAAFTGTTHILGTVVLNPTGARITEAFVYQDRRSRGRLNEETEREERKQDTRKALEPFRGQEEHSKHSPPYP